jgi:ABC-type transport system involved in multi-copper enzyme maturation permease subunit
MQAEVPVATLAAPPLPGFGVLFEKEVLESRRSKRMLIFLLIMTVAVVLVPVIGYFQVEDIGNGGRIRPDEEGMEAMLFSWTALIGYLASLMVIASTVDAVTRERSLGITAWVATKPVSRLSYLLAKACAEATMAAVTLVLIPTAVWLLLTVFFFAGVPLANVILATGILVIEVAFIAFFVVSVGAFFRSVPPVAIIALAFWFLPNIVPAIETLEWTSYVTPSYLPVSAVLAALDEPNARIWSIPLASLVLGAAAFTLAVLYFEQQEL